MRIIASFIFKKVNSWSACGMPAPPLVLGSRRDAMSTRIGIPLGHRRGPSGRMSCATTPSTPLPNISSNLCAILVVIDRT